MSLKASFKNMHTLTFFREIKHVLNAGKILNQQACILKMCPTLILLRSEIGKRFLGRAT